MRSNAPKGILTLALAFAVAFVLTVGTSGTASYADEIIDTGQEISEAVAEDYSDTDSGGWEDSFNDSDSGNGGDAGPIDDSGNDGDAGSIDDSGNGEDAGSIDDSGNGGDAGPIYDSGNGGDAGSIDDSGNGGDAGPIDDSGDGGDADPIDDSGNGGDAGPIDDSGNGGDAGSELPITLEDDKNVILITTADDLLKLANAINSGGFVKNYDLPISDAKVRLENDIDLGGLVFAPIGNEEHAFKAEFDGGGFTISNLTINRGSDNFQGLFGILGQGANVHDVRLTGVQINANAFVGGIAGVAEFATIRNCTVNGDISASDSLAGGIAGGALECLIENCVTSGTITAGLENAGGIVGQAAYDNCVIRNCSSSAFITVSWGAGGIAGTLSNANIEGCDFSGELVCNSDNSGSMAGNLEEISLNKMGISAIEPMYETTPIDSLDGEYADPANSDNDGDADPTDSGNGGDAGPIDSSNDGDADPIDSGNGGGEDPLDSGNGGNAGSLDSGNGGGAGPIDSDNGGDAGSVDPVEENEVNGDE